MNKKYFHQIIHSRYINYIYTGKPPLKWWSRDSNIHKYKHLISQFKPKGRNFWPSQNVYLMNHFDRLWTVYISIYHLRPSLCDLWTLIKNNLSVRLYISSANRWKIHISFNKTYVPIGLYFTPLHRFIIICKFNFFFFLIIWNLYLTWLRPEH